MKEEEERRIQKNGGKPLNYFLMPRSYKRGNGKLEKIDDDEGYYLVPLIYGRLAQPKGAAKVRR